MKLGEIMIESLMLIYPTSELMVDVDNDEALLDRILQLRGDSNYSDYLAAMPGAFNRCFSSRENKGVVPYKSHELDSAGAIKRGRRLLFDLSSIADLGSIARIAFYSDYGEIERCDYTHESGKSILLEERDGTYVVIYTPVIPRIKQISNTADEISLPEDVLELIPYFVKSELLRGENESEAALARNIYEQMVGELVNKQAGHQEAVENVYGELSI